MPISAVRRCIRLPGAKPEDVYQRNSGYLSIKKTALEPKMGNVRTNLNPDGARMEQGWSKDAARMQQGWSKDGARITPSTRWQPPEKGLLNSKK
jgi:hypothetical protein